MHVDARTCPLNSRSQTHPSPHLLCMQTPSGDCCEMNVTVRSVNIFSTFTVMFLHFFFQFTNCLPKATWRSSSLSIHRLCFVPIFRNIFPGAQTIMVSWLLQFRAFRVYLSIKARNCRAVITPQWQQCIYPSHGWPQHPP